MRELIEEPFWKDQPKLSSFQKLFSIIRWYPTHQLCRRAWKIAAAKLGLNRSQNFHLEPLPTCESAGKAILEVFQARLPQWKRQWSNEKASQFLSGGLTLLNSEMDLGRDFDWKRITHENSTHLWRFQLQYHEFFLRSLTFGTNSSTADQTRCLHQLIFERLEGWIAEYSNGQIRPNEDAWHPYCLSRRIPVWSQLLFALDLGDDQQQLVASQIQLFAKCLQRNLEWDLGGNHLLENLRGLAYAGALFSDSQWGKELLRFVSQQLKIQADIQTLPSGEHFERSPMYHCQVLWIYLEGAQLCRVADSSLSDFCLSVVERMYDFLSRVCHPDGEIPLFSDSVFEECPDVASICRLRNVIGKPKGSPPTSPQPLDKKPSDQIETDYFVFGENGNRTIVDCGDVAAVGLPAHGHCDHGNFETSLDGERVITDSGIVDYSGSRKQRFCKSSVSHNVTTLDGRNTCDIWGKFRMGFRGRIGRCRTGVIPNQPSSKYVSFQHDSYRRLRCSGMYRLIGQFDADNIFCFDYGDVEKATDANLARISLLHFHPRIQLERLDGFKFRFSTSINSWMISFFEIDSIELMNGLYCPEFGKQISRNSLVFQQNKHSRPFGWIMCRSELSDWSVSCDSSSIKISNPTSNFVHHWEEHQCI